MNKLHLFNRYIINRTSPNATINYADRTAEAK